MADLDLTQNARDAARDPLIKSLRECRAHQAGKAFGVPVVASLAHDEAVADAILASPAIDAIVAEQVAAAKAEAWDEGYRRAKGDHCDYYPSADSCDIASHNPYAS